MRHFAPALAALAACSSGLDVDPPENGMQLRMDVQSVAPGKEVLLCTYLPPLKKEIVVRSITFHQTAGGHHVALFALTTPKASGTSECADPNSAEGGIEMNNWRPVAAGTNQVLPPGVALKIPAGKQLMMQSHFVNTHDEPMESESAVNMYAFEGTPTHQADYLALNELDGLRIPQGEFTVTRECAIDHDLSLLTVLGHTHQYGTLYKLELQDLAGNWTELYHETDGAKLRNSPKELHYPPEAPLQIKAGQKWRYTCSWNNTTDHEIRFPEEMCAAFMTYFPSKGFIVCNDGENSVLP